MKTFYLKCLQLSCLFILALYANAPAQHTPSYEQEMQQWYGERKAALTAPDGWLNLEGLFWLKEGKNSFGSDTGNDIVVENKNMPGIAGYFDRHGDKISWHTYTGVAVKCNEEPVYDTVIFEPGHAASLLSVNNFRWNIIKRGDKLGVRFRNLEHAAIKEFKGIDHFDIDTAWRLPASLVPASNSNISIPNVLGQNTKQETPGKLAFLVQGTPYYLDAVDEGGDYLLIIFGDATSGIETYAAGRYIHVDKPGVDGRTMIDFNKAYNPPCAFTSFATCLLPTPQNILPFAILAGEKKYEHQH